MPMLSLSGLHRPDAWHPQCGFGKDALNAQGLSAKCTHRHDDRPLCILYRCIGAKLMQALQFVISFDEWSCLPPRSSG